MMTSDIKIIDNFCSEQEHKEILSLLSGREFPWFWSDDIVGYDDEITDNSKWQLQHYFYGNFEPRSPHYNLIANYMLSKLPKVTSVIRIKANLNPYTGKQNFKSMFHTDQPFLKHKEVIKSALYYLNTNNGYTLFKDGTKIESVANRIIIFPEHLKHTGVESTNTKQRLVINFNYI
jgi:hypothetical protein